MPQIEIVNLRKTYGKQIVIEQLSTIINSDQYCFLVGPNGSGKTTFIRCLLHLAKYEGTINTHNLVFAYAPDALVLPDYLSVIHLLKAMLRAIAPSSSEISQKITYYLRRFEMEKYYLTPIIHLSKGTKQKIIIIQTLLQAADVYVFDEPLNGLDHKMRQVFLHELQALKRQDKIIIIATHELTSYRFRYKQIITLGLNS